MILYDNCYYRTYALETVGHKEQSVNLDSLCKDSHENLAWRSDAVSQEGRVRVSQVEAGRQKAVVSWGNGMGIKRTREETSVCPYPGKPEKAF